MNAVFVSVSSIVKLMVAYYVIVNIINSCVYLMIELLLTFLELTKMPESLVVIFSLLIAILLCFHGSHVVSNALQV